MVKIDTLCLGSYATNCYIVRATDSSQCVVIDPGYSPEQILKFLQKNNLSLQAILLTHGHFDHVGAVRSLAADTDCAVYLHKQELSLPAMMTDGALYYTHTYKEGDTLSLAGLTFRVLHTPGHTPGSVCLQAENALFSGDTLFAGSCGRVDFPGSSPKDMRQSLSRLSELQEDLTVYPGHAESTTLRWEQQTNPYMKGML